MFKGIIKEIIYRTVFRTRNLAYQCYKHSDELDKFRHLVEAVNYVRVAQQRLVVFEFGCHSARTFSTFISAAKFFKLPTDNIYAFDSFEGLPEEENSGVFKQGEFSTSEAKFRKLVHKKTGLILNDSQVIKGFYSESLISSDALSLPIPSIVHVDVDLYGSTVEILKFLEKISWKRLLIIFDDWYCFAPDSKNGERLAFEEFLAENPRIRCEHWKNYSTFGRSLFLWRE